MCFQSIGRTCILSMIPAFSMGGVPDPIFSRPNIKEKIAVWLRETNSKLHKSLHNYKGSIINKANVEQKTLSLSNSLNACVKSVSRL